MGVEHQAVIHGRDSDCADHLEDVLAFTGERESLDIDIPGRPASVVCGEEHSTLEDQTIGVWRPRQSKEEALEGVELLKFVRGTVLPPGQILQIQVRVQRRLPASADRSLSQQDFQRRPHGGLGLGKALGHGQQMRWLRAPAPEPSADSLNTNLLALEVTQSEYVDNGPLRTIEPDRHAVSERQRLAANAEGFHSESVPADWHLSAWIPMSAWERNVDA
jgi:hypothetical protein